MSKLSTGMSREMLCVQRGLPSFVISSLVIAKLSIRIASVYIEPAVSIRESDISAFIRELCTSYIIYGDFNSHNELWGSSQCDTRGLMLEDIWDKFDLIVSSMMALPLF